MVSPCAKHWRVHYEWLARLERLKKKKKKGERKQTESHQGKTQQNLLGRRTKVLPVTVDGKAPKAGAVMVTRLRARLHPRGVGS